jgi:hypothetical protein
VREIERSDEEHELAVEEAMTAGLGRKWRGDKRARRFARKTLVGLAATAPDGVDPALYAFFMVLRALWFVRRGKRR